MNARTEYELAQFGSLAVLGLTIYNQSGAEGGDA
jgi:hypothetical protein